MKSNEKEIQMSLPLAKYDPEIYNLVKSEENRQSHGLELIASENFTSTTVMQTLGSCLTNKYSEGLPGKRYYGGNQFIDQIELLCQKRALQTFSLDKDQWAVNVQALSGTGANFAVYTGLLKPGDRLMGLDLPSGGHLSHGYQTATKKISAVSVYFCSKPYGLHPETHLVDYKELHKQALEFKPKLIVAGASAYSREWDYKRMRQICDEIGAYLMADIAHISGLVASGVQANPFEFCDIVTTTTHKTLRGPRSGLIFCRKHLIDQINFAIFPMLNGGPHNHQIAAVAVALLEAQQPEFKEYCKQIIRNAQTLAKYLIERGYTIQTNGTDNHLFLWNLRANGVTGSKFEKICELVGITLNKNTVYGDKSALSPGGVRIGTPALTTRGFKEQDMHQVGEFLIKTLQLTKSIQSQTTSKKLSDFCKLLELSKNANHLQNLRQEITIFASKFPMPKNIF